MKEWQMYDLSELEKYVSLALKNKKRIIVAITGLCGSGKSTLGKFIRKNGIGGGQYKPYKIAVIDDSVMT